ncbi:MAG: MFS transporter [Chloroflexi bacterium]|nr:MFS transporter [Chloroflexota bacterium]
MSSRTNRTTKRPWARRTPFFYGWVILGVASFTGFISGPGQTYGVSVFVDPMIEDLGLSRTLIAGIYAGGSLTAAASMILVGRLLDRYGARVVLMGATALFGVALLWMSNVNSPFDLYLGFAGIRTLGQGSLTLIPTTLLAVWFVRRRGRVMPFFFVGSAASQAIFPPLIHKLVTEFEWRGAWVALAFLVWGALLLPVILLVRRSPESVGLLPDGDTTDSESDPGLSQQTAPPMSHEVEWTLREALRTRAFWLLLLTAAPQPLIGTALVFNHISLMDSRGLDSGVAASVLSVLAPSALVGSFAAGYFLDRVPNRYILAAGQVVLVIAMLFPLVIEHSWQAFLYGGLLGLSGGCLMTTHAVIWPNYYGRANLGTIRGVGATSVVAFSALGPLPFAFLFEQTDTYTTALLVFLALPAAGIVAALFASPPRKAPGFA